MANDHDIDDSNDPGDLRRALSELDRRHRRRRPLAFLLTMAPVLAVGAILGALVLALSDGHRRVEAQQRNLDEMAAKKRQLDAEIQARERELAVRKSQIDVLAADHQEMLKYSDKLRSIIDKGKPGAAESVTLQETGAIPASLRSGIRPRARVTPQASDRGAEVYDVDLWLEIPAGSAGAVEGVTYDLDARFYTNNHFASPEEGPDKPVRFTALGCESKVLTTVKLKTPPASMTIDFDWCQAAAWPARRGADMIGPPAPPRPETAALGQGPDNPADITAPRSADRVLSAPRDAYRNLPDPLHPLLPVAP